MLENKYYTPDITEFHVGFECEYTEPNENEWQEDILSDRDVAYLLAYPHACRVKYLDKEDIESLGFINLGSLWFIKENCLTSNSVNNLNCKIRKWKNSEIDIYADYIDSDPQLIFRGTIKNKSELKLILKQLGYEYK